MSDSAHMSGLVDKTDEANAGQVRSAR